MSTRWTIGRRAVVGLALVSVAFLADGIAFPLARWLTLEPVWDEWGEIKEALAAAKFLASALGTVIVALAIALLDRRGRRRAAVYLAVVLTAGMAGSAVKGLAGRVRPCEYPTGQERTVFRGPLEGVPHSVNQSFPSGHTASAFAAATCLAHFYPAAAPVAYGVAAAAGVNRLVKRQHFLSDVLAGALLGHLLAWWLLRRRWARVRWQLVALTGAAAEPTVVGPADGRDGRVARVGAPAPGGESPSGAA